MQSRLLFGSCWDSLLEIYFLGKMWLPLKGQRWGRKRAQAADLSGTASVGGVGVVLYACGF